MAAGVTNKLWRFDDLLAGYAAKPRAITGPFHGLAGRIWGMDETDNPHDFMLWVLGWLFIAIVAVLLTFAIVFVPAVQKLAGASLPYLKVAALAFTVYHIFKLGFYWTTPKT